MQSVLTASADDKSTFLVYQSPAPDAAAREGSANFAEFLEGVDQELADAARPGAKASNGRTRCRRKLETEVCTADRHSMSHSCCLVVAK